MPNSRNRHELAGVTSWGYGCAIVSIYPMKIYFILCTINVIQNAKCKKKGVNLLRLWLAIVGLKRD